MYKRQLVQGTIYPDVVESGLVGESAVIKSHHNVGGLPDYVDFKAVSYTHLRQGKLRGEAVAGEGCKGKTGIRGRWYQRCTGIVPVSYTHLATG